LPVTIPWILTLIAVICFAVTALGLASLVALGLAFWASASLLKNT